MSNSLIVGSQNIIKGWSRTTHSKSLSIHGLFPTRISSTRLCAFGVKTLEDIVTPRKLARADYKNWNDLAAQDETILHLGILH